MRNLLTKFICPLFGLAMIASACSDWTDLEPKYPMDLTQTDKPDSYYEALKAYKNSDHAVAFGWYGNHTGVGVSLENTVKGLPDSVDFVSMWGGWKNILPDALADIHETQQKKGTKFLACCIVMEMGDQITPEEHNATRADRHRFWGWVDGDEEAIRQSIVRYANAFADSIDKYNLDGFDLDWEPSYPQPFPTNKEMCHSGRIAIFLQTLIDRGMGLRGGTGRMLVIDGEPEHSEIPKEMGKDFNFFISQAYACRSDQNLNGRLSNVIQHYDGVLTADECAKKFIVCENFENYAQTGGVDGFIDFEGNRYKSLEGMAHWLPRYGVDQKPLSRKGGVGTYHMEYEYNVSGKEGHYPYLRQAIQIMNPAKK